MVMGLVNVGADRDSATQYRRCRKKENASRDENGSTARKRLLKTARNRCERNDIGRDALRRHRFSPAQMAFSWSGKPRANLTIRRTKL
jgi:hypothetical protein